MRIIISKINRFNIDYPILLCKIMKRTKNNQYVLRSKFEIINIYYLFEKIESLEIQYFSELNNLSSNKISVKKATYLQSIRLNTNIIYNYKYNCNNNKCNCKKKESNCESKYYGSHPYQNKCNN